VRGCARLGLRPHAIAGTSVGAAVGALWAAGLDADAIARIAQRLDWSAGAATAFGRLLFGRRRNEPLYAEIERAVGARRIEQLPVRFAAVATDLELGEPVVLDTGPVAPAVAASSAVPVWFEPVRIGSHALIDGSLTAPVPVEAARLLGAQRVVAVDIAFRPYEEAPSGALDHAFQALHIATNALAGELTRSADHLIKLDLHHLMHGRFDPEALIDAGEQALLALGPALRGS
jgi:NTE family protein